MKIIDRFEEKYRFLSNFFIEKNGRSVEHYFQAAKTDDQEWKEKIMNAKNPAEAKKLGRKAPMRETWNQDKIQVMAEQVIKKFMDKELAKRLIDTGDAILIEGNDWHDNFWGDCQCREKPGRFGQKEKCKGKGLNVLGQILMIIRKQLKEYGFLSTFDGG